MPASGCGPPLQDPSLANHPQGSPNGNSLILGSGGAWRVACQFGTPSSTGGQAYDLLIVTATKAADQEFIQYLATAQANGYKGLSPFLVGATPVGTVHVFR
jgi:aspartate oxidase